VGSCFAFFACFGINYLPDIRTKFQKAKIISKKSIRLSSNRSQVSFDINKIDRNLIDHNQLNLIRMLYHNSDAVAYANNKIDVLSDGKTTFDAMFEAIRNAKTIFMSNFYLWE